MNFRKINIILFIFIVFAENINAAELRDFVAASSKNKLTVNPASTAMILRPHLEYGLFSFGTKDTKGPSMISDHKYKKGKYVEGRVAFVWPFAFASIGLEAINQKEEYQNKDNLSYLGKRKANESIDKKKLQLYLGFPAGTVFIGLRVKTRKFHIEKKVTFSGVNARNYKIIGDVFYDINACDGTPIDEDKEKNIYREYQYVYDYGIIYPDLLPGLDIGAAHIYGNSEGSRFRYKIIRPNSSMSASNTFSEPSLLQIGIGYTLELENFGLQILGDSGSYQDIENNFQGEKTKGKTTGGGLIRFAIGEFIEFSYGANYNELGNYRIQKDTFSIQLLFMNDIAIQFGSQSLKIIDDNERILSQITVPQLSASLQLGTPVKRPLHVKPKTKRLGTFDYF